MKLSQIIRIAVALAIIFAAGVMTGRWSTPKGPVQMAAPGGKMITSDNVTARLVAELGLDAGQRATIEPIIEDASEQMAVLPPGSPQRRDVFRKVVPRVREHLRPDQLPNMDRYVEMAERKWARMIRRREMMLNNTNLPAPTMPPARRPALP